MNTWYLYFLLPAFFFPLSFVIATSVWRRIWARKLSLYRQFTLSIIWLPIGISLLSKPELLQENIFSILLCGLLGTAYLTIAFYAVNLTSIGISRSFITISRTLCGFFIGFSLFWESIHLFDYVWVAIIFLGLYILWKDSGEKLTSNDIYGIVLSLIGGIIFACNNLVFKNISEVFWPIESAYILESSSLIPLFILYLFTHKLQDISEMWNDKKEIGILFLTAPLVLLASYGLAQSVVAVPFYIFNSLFVIILVMSIIFGWIFLGEKTSPMRAIALTTMIIGCLVIVLS